MSVGIGRLNPAFGSSRSASSAYQKSDDRFARQDRYGPPPEFPLASPCPGIVHHLSGPNACARAPPPRRGGRDGPVVRPRRTGEASGSHLGPPDGALHLHCATAAFTTPRARRRDDARGALGTVRPAPGPRERDDGGGRAVAPWEGRPGPPEGHRRAPPRERSKPPTAREVERRQGGRARRRVSGFLGPGIRRALLPGGCNTRGGVVRRPRVTPPPPSHLPQTGPSQPSRSRSRRTATVEVRPAAAGRRPGGGPPPTPPPAPPARPRHTPRPPPERRDAGRGNDARVEGSGGTGSGKDPPGNRRHGRTHAAGLNPPGGLRGPHPFTS
ncbi:proline-rich protein 2-like [Peromyscus eremicus]|uniref:proline-rich protein 2-like n=1 Tax=Peromyscus eremicus TaxID=42410 RepID=UPI0027DDE3DC|nr:proline-rich protein 2-like [Peromyscus eremicus]